MQTGLYVRSKKKMVILSFTQGVGTDKRSRIWSMVSSSITFCLPPCIKEQRLIGTYCLPSPLPAQVGEDAPNLALLAKSLSKCSTGIHSQKTKNCGIRDGNIYKTYYVMLSFFFNWGTDALLIGKYPDAGKG